MPSPAVSLLSAEDGTPLHVADWSAAETRGARRGVLILHGLGEHGGRYAHVAGFFLERGFDVRIHDHRGHGRSSGRRGDVPDETALLRDAALVLRDFARHFDAPPLLLGHSMGGLLAAHLACARLKPISGLILSSPALAITLSRTQSLLLAAMSALAPGVAVPNGVPAARLSHDATVVDAYRNDPLVHARITARLLRSMLAAIDCVQQNATAINVPVLLLVAGSDHIVDARGSDAFFARLPADAGTLRHYPDLYHEIFNEPDAPAVFADLQSWLDAHALPPPPAVPARTA